MNSFFRPIRKMYQFHSNRYLLFQEEVISGPDCRSEEEFTPELNAFIRVWIVSGLPVQYS